MCKFDIVFASARQVQRFVEIAERQNFDVQVESHNQAVNGKNFMGMFSLQYDEPVQVLANCAEGEFLIFQKEVQAVLI